jgi:hypothetical protein
MPSSQSIKTRGDVLIRKRGQLTATHLYARELRCYGIINHNQGRILVNGKLRRRVVHISKRSRSTCFEIHGFNGIPVISELRLVPQPFWRVRKLLATKLLRLHPAYRRESLKQRSFSQQWLDYNHLLSRKNFQLVGYDDWIEQVELPALLEQVQQNKNVSPQANPQPKSVNFATWLWGDRNNDLLCQISIQSVKNQIAGPFQLLPPEQQLQEEDHQTWIVFLQAGDQLAPQTLARFTALIQAHPDAGR